MDKFLKESKKKERGLCNVINVTVEVKVSINDDTKISNKSWGTEWEGL